MNLEEQIFNLKSKGLSLRNIAKELNIPFHKLRNTIYKSQNKSNNNKNEAQSIIKQAKKIISVAKQDIKPIQINQECKKDLIDLKSIAYFDKIADHIERINQSDKRIQKLETLIETLEERISNGNFLDKDERATISTLIRLYERVSDDTKNNSTNIKETLQTIAGSIQSGIIPKHVERIEEKEENKNITNLVQLEGTF